MSKRYLSFDYVNINSRSYKLQLGVISINQVHSANHTWTLIGARETDLKENTLFETNKTIQYVHQNLFE